MSVTILVQKFFASVFAACPGNK